MGRRKAWGRSVAVALAALSSASCASHADSSGVSSDHVPRPTSGDTGVAHEAVPGPGTRLAGTSDDFGVDVSVGSCLDWDFGEVDVRLVDCASLHRIQVAGEEYLGDRPSYPSVREWYDAAESACTPLVEAFIGGELDPYGRFTTSATTPTAEEWASGSRLITCGIASRVGTPNQADREPPFVGDLEGAADPSLGDGRILDQAFTFPRGACVRSDELARKWEVPCTEPHDMEVVSRMTYTDRVEPPDGIAVQEVMFRCAAEAREYLGDDPPWPWASAVESIADGSWAAGTRAIHCHILKVDEDGSPVEVSEPAPRR